MAEPSRHPKGIVVKLKLDFEKGPRRLGPNKSIKKIITKKQDNSYVTYDYRLVSGNGPAQNSSY